MDFICKFSEVHIRSVGEIGGQFMIVQNKRVENCRKIFVTVCISGIYSYVLIVKFSGTNYSFFKGVSTSSGLVIFE